MTSRTRPTSRPWSRTACFIRRIQFCAESNRSALRQNQHMKRALITIFLGGIALSIFAAESAPTDDWKLVKQTNGVAIYNRPHPGSRLKEFKAVGEIDATTETIHKVIDDV